MTYLTGSADAAFEAHPGEGARQSKAQGAFERFGQLDLAGLHKIKLSVQVEAGTKTPWAWDQTPQGVNADRSQ